MNGETAARPQLAQEENGDCGVDTEAPDPTQSDRVLKLTYSGRIIDHLGLQMYQSSVAAVAELVANAWDADADQVTIDLPEVLGDGAEIVVEDDGNGMTFEQCQKRFLNVGYARRGESSVQRSLKKQRRILGRKGIGKFAGFGVAEVVLINTVSADTGEQTVFAMDVSKLRTDEYVDIEGKEVDLIKYDGPDDSRRQMSGTTVRLRRLLLSRTPNPEGFARSMSRRFLLYQTVSDFQILVNADPLPDTEDLIPLQFSFPSEYRDQESPHDLKIDDDWAIETVGQQEIKWRVRFYRDPIGDEELRGMSVFAGVKLVQAPFFFNLSGGLPGQHGLQYLSGQVQADFIDEQQLDLIAPERQRVNWDHSKTSPIQEWGQRRLKELLGLWKSRRGEERRRRLDERLEGFAARLQRLQAHERKTVTQALSRLAQIETLSDTQFEELGLAMLTAWEQGRLRDLIGDIAQVEDLTADQLVEILAEAQVLTALNTAEAVRTKLEIVGGLKRRIINRELENAVRDFISHHPWLVSPKWETFAVERSMKTILDHALNESGIAADADFNGRVDLALSSGDHLLVLEFMRPGLRLDWDHANRFERYVRIVRTSLRQNTGGKFSRVTGYLVADKLGGRSGLLDKIESLAREDMFAQDWPTLFSNAVSQWREFLETLAARDTQDERLQVLISE